MSNPITVLVVDGDAHNLMTLSALLKTLDIRYKRNTTGQNVLPQAHVMLPRLDAIMIDLNLPDADAFAICHALKSDPTLAKIPVIAMVNEHSEEQLQRVRLNGFSGLVARPFPRQQFEAYLRRLINGGERGAENGKH
jgi:PleD family two-component response regulator